MTAPLCFLDTETDGVHPDRKVWEIGCIRRDSDGTETVYETFVHVDDIASSDLHGLRVGKFFHRHPYGKRAAGRDHGGEGTVSTRAEAALAVSRLTYGARIVGAVPNFDTETLAPLLHENGLLPGWNYHLIDVGNLVMGYLAGQGRPLPDRWKFDDVLESLGVPRATPEAREAAHTALGDARWAMQVYDIVLGGGET